MNKIILQFPNDCYVIETTLTNDQVLALWHKFNKEQYKKHNDPILDTKMGFLEQLNLDYGCKVFNYPFLALEI